MIDVKRKKQDLANGKESLAIHVSASGVTLYMNRHALRKLTEKLAEIGSANPEDCNEVHIGSMFSFFDRFDTPISPKVTFSDGLSELISRINSVALQELISSGEVPKDAYMAPFEVTIMHVSREAVDEEALRPNS